MSGQLRTRTDARFRIAAILSLMHFDLVDNILECSNNRIVVVKQVSNAEDYLRDHFPTFPVLPGVMMVETMTQAARQLLSNSGHHRFVLGRVKAMKFGNMVRPGDRLEMHVELKKSNDDGTFDFKATGYARKNSGEDGATAVAGRFTMRALCTARSAAAAHQLEDTTASNKGVAST